MLENTVAGKGDEPNHANLQHADVFKEYKEGTVSGNIVCDNIRNYWAVFFLK